MKKLLPSLSGAMIREGISTAPEETARIARSMIAMQSCMGSKARISEARIISNGMAATSYCDSRLTDLMDTLNYIAAVNEQDEEK